MLIILSPLTKTGGDDKTVPEGGVKGRAWIDPCFFN